MTALYFGGYLRLDLDNNNLSNDRDRVIIRGHMGPLRYCIFNLLGWVNDEELNHYRQLGSRLHGHEKMGSIPGVDITPSGALGMVLSYGVGAAIESKNNNQNYRTIVFLGDGEEQEGNVSEAARHAAALGLDNLICIIDRNKKQLSRPTSDVDKADLNQVWEGYGWEVFEIRNGHDLEEINKIYNLVFNTPTNFKPRLIIANTIKGQGLPGAEENCCGYHTINAFGGEKLKQFVSQRRVPFEEKIKEIVSNIPKNYFGTNENNTRIDPSVYFKQPEHLSESLGEELGNFFKHCADLMEKGYPVYVITADMMPVDETKGYNLEEQQNFIDVGIREQHMLALSHAISATNSQARIVMKSHDAFIYRAADQIQTINIGGTRVILFGDYGGLSGNFNGETHESTGQPGMMLMMGNALVFEPADARDFWNVANYSLVNNPGLVYIRLYSREAPLLPRVDNESLWFYRTFQSKDKPEIIIVSCGLTAKDSYLAGEILDKEGISTKVINVVHLNATQSKDFAQLFDSDVPILTVYNGNPFVLESLVSTALLKYSEVRPRLLVGHGFIKGTTGSMPDLKTYFGLDYEGIIKKAKETLLIR